MTPPLLSLLSIAESGSQSESVLIVTLIAGHVVTIVGLIVKAFVDQSNRKQDRLDAELKSKLLHEEVAASARLAADKGAEREGRIVAKIAENTDFNKLAIETANGHNTKIKNAVESVAEVAKAIKGSRP
jgi:hypothetical protein